MDEKKRIGEHIVDYLSGELDGKVADPALEEWLAEDASNRDTFEGYQRIWEETASFLRKESIDTEAAWKRVDAINRRKAHGRMRLIHVGYAAASIAATLLLVLWISFMGAFDRKPGMIVQISTDRGSRSEIVLPDGSVVRLNSGSDLSYAYDADKRIREVRFQGEGFFDVAKDKKAPFVISMADSLRLRVHGTSFNLKAYADEEAVEASLVEGCIELDHDDEVLIIKAGDKAVFDKRTRELKPVTGEDLSRSYGWLEDKLYMEHTSLASVCRYLERRYNVAIRLQEGLGESIHYNGVIQENNIMDVLNVLSRLSDIDYTVKGKNIYITSK